MNDDENDYGCKPDASQGGPEHNVLRVFDELATTRAFDGVPDEAPSEHDEDIEVDDDLANTLGSLQARRRVRISGRRVTVAQAAAADDARLQQLPNLLKSHPVASRCSAASQLIVANKLKFEARLKWRARPVRQLLRATNDLYRKPWWDYALYEAPGARAGAKPHLGLARLLVHAVDGRRCDIVVVQRLEDADARPGCVLTSLNCRRKRWVINHGTGFPELSLVPLENVLRLEHVVPDFEDLAERWGMTATPTTVPDSPQEREEQRFFTNALFPWTSNSVTEAP